MPWALASLLTVLLLDLKCLLWLEIQSIAFANFASTPINFTVKIPLALPPHTAEQNSTLTLCCRYRGAQLFSINNSSSACMGDLKAASSATITETKTNPFHKEINAISVIAVYLPVVCEQRKLPGKLWCSVE